MASPFGRCASAVLILSSASAASAAPRFTHLSLDHGLSQATARVILQDHAGFLWLGTEEGLNRYDGYGFTVFKHDPRDPQSLPDDLIASLYEDRQHVLWVGSGRGLARFDRRSETFVPVEGIRERVNDMLEDPNGTLWVACSGDGLFERRPGSTTFILHAPNSEDPSSLASHQISRLLRDRRGRLWVGTRDAGVDRLDAPPKSGLRRSEDPEGFVHHRHDPRDPKSLDHDEVWGLAEDAEGNIWVATYGGGLNVIDPATGASRHYRHRPGDPNSLPTDLLTDVLVDRSGAVWVGTNGSGLLRFDAASQRFVAMRHDPADPASLSHNVVRKLYQDPHDQLWVGTYLGGANVLQKQRVFAHYTHGPADPASLSDPEVTSFLEDREGRFWVGTVEGWLNRFDRKTETFVRHAFPSWAPRTACVLALHQDRRGRIWAGTYRAGLGRFDPERGAFTVYKPDEPGAVLPQIWAIAEDDDGSLWLGTGTGVARFDPEQAKVTERYTTFTPQGFSHSDVRALLRDREGNLWVGCLGGLDLRLRGGGGFVSYRHDDKDPRSLSHNGVVSLHEDRNGVLWVGTFGGGLNRLDRASGTFTCYRDFPSNVIYGIQEDSGGRLWLSTNHGLSRFDPGSGRSDNFDLTNGLETLQGTLGATLRTREGRMLVGTVDGFYDFDPDSIAPDTHAPKVVFTSLRVFDDPMPRPIPLSTLDSITLAPRDRAFSIEFAALDHMIPRRNQYAYRLEGFSDRWIRLGARRELTLTNLDPGTYRLQVKASNSDGVWSDASMAVLTIVVPWRVRPVWWFSALALAVVVVAAAARRLRRKPRADTMGPP
jgi:ligand-binding sensor domain-containing protein